MRDYTKFLPEHKEIVLGEADLFLEIYEPQKRQESGDYRPPLLFVHGAYTGSWMWSKYIPLFVQEGWKCYVMNLRSHYKSRVMDMTKVTFDDYLSDIQCIINECKKSPILIGFSLGGILCQKIAESEMIAGLVLIDSCISKEVNQKVPYSNPMENQYGNVDPAPIRDEVCSIDETEEDIIFQRKYLSMESSLVFKECACWVRGIEGISINHARIQCPCLVIKSVNCEEEDQRGKVESEYLSAEYEPFHHTTHTGLLIGQRFAEVADRIIKWLKRFE